MSQKKVDDYKKYKKNRRENIKKEKRKEQLTIAAMWGALVLFIVCVGSAMGVTIYNNYQAKLAALPTYASTSFVLSDMAGMQKKDAQTPSQEESTSEEDASEEELSSEESSEKETGTQTENEDSESESAQ